MVWTRQTGRTLDTEAAFRAQFEAHYGDLLGYALRRCGTRQDAEDVVAETFQIAWRRVEELPPAEEVRLWLFGTARRVLANHHRGNRRARSLIDRIKRDPGTRSHEEGPAQAVARGDVVLTALGRLSDLDREILQLHAWEDLSSPEIADVLDISPAAARKRLQRARDRFASALDDLTQTDRSASSRFGDVPVI